MFIEMKIDGKQCKGRMPISSTDLIMDANFRGQRGWATMYSKKVINSNFYVKGCII